MDAQKRVINIIKRPIDIDVKHTFEISTYSQTAPRTRFSVTNVMCCSSFNGRAEEIGELWKSKTSFLLIFRLKFFMILYDSLIRMKICARIINKNKEGTKVQWRRSYLWLTWVPNFIALGIYFIFGTKFSWNEGIDTCFNVKSVLFGCNLDFLGGYYWSLHSGYCSLRGGYCLLPVVTARYHLLLVIPTFSMYAYKHILS